MLLLFSALQLAAAEPETATVTGRVTYTADPDRPWRYSRYYVNGRRSGELAEAVVCLSSRALRRFGKAEESHQHTVDQENFRFVPETLAIREGDRILFTNSDGAVHNVMTGDGIDPFNVNMVQGEKHEIRFRRAGGTKKPIRIGCVFHSAMQCWVYVFKHPFFAVTGEDGRFEIAGVPPGEYELLMVHPAGDLAWSREVTVTAGGELAIDIPVSPDQLAKDVR
ncbi:MAG: plastocyanin/azurin family copper-binding protein [Maioricimonas sp. JB049]